MDVVLIKKRYVDCRSIILLEIFYIVFLDCPALLDNAIILVRQYLLEESVPFAVCKCVPIQQLKLLPEIGNQLSFTVDWKIRISLLSEHSYELSFKSRLTLVSIRPGNLGNIFCYNCTLIRRQDNVICTHASSFLLKLRSLSL